MTASLNCLLLVCNGCAKCSSWVDLSITINICSSFLGLVLKAIWAKFWMVVPFNGKKNL